MNDGGVSHTCWTALMHGHLTAQRGYTQTVIRLPRFQRFTTISGNPVDQGLEVFEVRDLKGRWVCFRHKDADPIEEHELYDAEGDKPREEIADESLFGNGHIPEHSDEFDTCIAGVEYGGDGPPWGASPDLEESDVKTRRPAARQD